MFYLLTWLLQGKKHPRFVFCCRIIVVIVQHTLRCSWFAFVWFAIVQFEIIRQPPLPHLRTRRGDAPVVRSFKYLLAVVYNKEETYPTYVCMYVE